MKYAKAAVCSSVIAIIILMSGSVESREEAPTVPVDETGGVGTGGYNPICTPRCICCVDSKVSKTGCEQRIKEKCRVWWLTTPATKPSKSPTGKCVDENYCDYKLQKDCESANKKKAGSCPMSCEDSIKKGSNCLVSDKKKKCLPKTKKPVPVCSPATKKPTKKPTAQPTTIPTDSPTANPTSVGRRLDETHFFDLFSTMNIPFVEKNADIPNIVHFIWIRETTQQMNMKLTEFVAIYSAFFHLKPEAIYIHAYPTSDITKMNDLAKRAAKIPGVKFVDAVLPEMTHKGIPITNLAHKSDFMRPTILENAGGIYLDLDAYIIQDLRPLLKMGVQNILGEQIDGSVANGIMMCAPKSEFMKVFGEMMHENF